MTVTARVTHTERHEWTVPTPSYVGELNKALAAASEGFRTTHGRKATWDDDIRITSDETSLTVWFEVRKGHPAPVEDHDVESWQCPSRGPRIGSEGKPWCGLERGHDGPHQPDPDAGFGSIQWHN